MKNPVNIIINKGRDKRKDSEMKERAMLKEYGCLGMGHIYINGDGVLPNYRKARYYYELALDDGEALAANELGCIYMNGIGVLRDYTKAAAYFQYAAERGVVYAMENLAYCYENGLGVPRELYQAQRWRNIAADKDSIS